MSDSVRIPAKCLGQMALPSFCPRCFWLRLKCRNRLPFQIFPGIFSSIDSYSKKITRCHFERFGEPPGWLKDFGNLERLVHVPHFSRFFIIDQATHVMLTGAPDEIIQRNDDSYFIIDYKTARFTRKQDELLPMYRVQLNAYAYIAERCGFSPVSGIGLVYYEPQTDLSADDLDEVLFHDGFRMGFRAKLVELEMEPEEIVPPLLQAVRKLSDQTRPPESVDSCGDCRKLGELMALVT